MKKTYREKALRCAILLVGLTIAHFGVALYLLADLGADPFNVLIQGILRAVRPVFGAKVTHGNVHMAVSLLIILVLWIVDKTYIRIGTVLCMLCGGPIIDFFQMILGPLFAAKHPLWTDIAVEAGACVILAFGMTIVIKSEAGTGPNDLVALVISEKLRRKFSVVRMLTDVTFVAVGFAAGGSVGIGTLICAFLVGPVAGFFLPHSERYVKRVLEKLSYD